MCGRYAASRSPDDLIEEFEIERLDVRERLAPDFNVAPTKDVYAVLSRPPREDRTAPAQRRLTVVRWGLVPSWASDLSIGSRLINARMETVTEKPAFRKAFASRRCILPADGYFEWYGETRGHRQPFFIRPRDGHVLAMAGIYEIWRNPALDRDDPAAFVWSCAVLTTTAEDAVGHIHDRMPLMLEPDRYASWLEPSDASPEALLGLLVPATPGRLEAFPVSRRVSDVRNNGPDLVDPLPAQGDAFAALF